MANNQSQEVAHNEARTITATVRSATTVDAAQKAADKLVNDTIMQVTTEVRPDGSTRSDYISQMNKDLEEKKILPALSLAYLTDENRWAAVSKKDGSIDKEHIEQYKRERNISEESIEGLYLNKAEQLIGNKKVNQAALLQEILLSEKSLQKVGTAEATKAAELLTKARQGANTAETLLDQIDHGGDDYTSDRRVSLNEIQKFLNNNESRDLSKEDRNTLENLLINSKTPQVKALLNDQGYLSLNQDDQAANKNTLDQYLKKHENDSDNSSGQPQPNKPNSANAANNPGQPADSNVAANPAKPADAGAAKPTEQARPPRLYDTLPAIAARNDLPPAEQEDLKKLSAAGYKLDPNDHGDKANPHTEVYKGPNGEVIAIDRDSSGNAVGYTEGNTNTNTYWAYKKYADADPNTPGQTAKWAFYEGSQPKWTTGGVTMDSTGKVRAKEQRLPIAGQVDPNNVGDY